MIPAGTASRPRPALHATKDRLTPGQRVGVAVPLKDQRDALTVPWAAVVIDVYGGTWVYERAGEHSFARHRVVVRYVRDGEAVLASGPKPGTRRSSPMARPNCSARKPALASSLSCCPLSSPIRFVFESSCWRCASCCSSLARARSSRAPSTSSPSSRRRWSRSRPRRPGSPPRRSRACHRAARERPQRHDRAQDDPVEVGARAVVGRADPRGGDRPDGGRGSSCRSGSPSRRRGCRRSPGRR